LETVWLVLTGLAGGFLAGLLGIGGGIIYILIFPLFLKSWEVPQPDIVDLTVANSILATMISAFSGNVTAIVQKEFYWAEVFTIALASIICSILTLGLVTYSPGYSTELFNYVIIVVLVYLLISTFLRPVQRIRKSASESNGKWLALTGLFSGGVASLSGLGGGAVIIPILIRYYGMDIKKAKSISLGVIFFTALFMTGYTYWMFETPSGSSLLLADLTLPVAFAVVISTPIGVRTARNLSARHIRVLFGIFLSMVILNKTWQIIVQSWL
jgi:uncharacterized membrane protein YfcA